MDVKRLNEKFTGLLEEKEQKMYRITVHRSGRSRSHEGTLADLTQHHSYTLQTGKSYEHEKGNKKINLKPRTISDLVKNLRNASNNSARNGYSGIHYEHEEL